MTDDSPTGAPPLERDVEVDGTPRAVSRPRLLVQAQPRDTRPRHHPSGEVVVTVTVDEDGASADYEGGTQ